MRACVRVIKVVETAKRTPILIGHSKNWRGLKKRPSAAAHAGVQAGDRERAAGGVGGGG
jgi:hypothetical protein